MPPRKTQRFEAFNLLDLRTNQRLILTTRSGTRYWITTTQHTKRANGSAQVIRGVFIATDSASGRGWFTQGPDDTIIGQYAVIGEGFIIGQKKGGKYPMTSDIVEYVIE
ncbi:hypothetical protein I8H83_02895 [Candidatus Saccharibacteria bacterium]|nr:hypothetical protein [Candidatus Saccharibacteria bacterium]MBH2007525.1 hypothetical protein [Candidatus Saccharibacteria bacterium]